MSREANFFCRTSNGGMNLQSRGDKSDLREINRKSDTRTEGVLALAILAILLPALALVFLAKWHIAMPDNAVMINQATSEKIASTLGIDADIAARIVAYRKEVGSFDDTDRLLTVPLLSAADAKQAGQTFSQSRLDLRTATASQFAEALKLRPAVAARLAAYRDAHVSEFPPITVADLVQKSPASTSQQSTSKANPSPTTARLFRHATALDPVTAALLLKRFVLRRPAAVFRTFAFVTLVLSSVIVFIPVWLRKQQKLGGDPFLIPLALLLSSMGVVMLFSIKDPFRDGAAYLHHTVGIVIAVVVMLSCAKLARSARGRIRHYQYVWVGAAVGLVVMLFIFGRGPEGVKLNLFGIQPVELIKLFLVFFAASYLADRAGLIADASRRYTPPKFEGVKRSDGRSTLAIAMPRAQDLGPVAVMFSFSLVLFFVIKDLGPGLLLFAVFIAMLYLTTGKSSFVVIGVALILVGGGLGYLRHVGVFGTRVDMWLSPFANTHPNGMQLGQSYWGIASGGWEGSGLGLGMPGLTPRAGSDLAFVSWVEETGLPGAWLVLTIYALLVWRGMRIALRAGSEFDRSLAFGLTALLGLQTLLILFGVTGVTPLTGISLPFLSYGNSALVADFVIIGLLRGISVPAPGGGDRLEVRREVQSAARHFAVAVAAALIGIVGIWRLGSMQLIRSDEFASHPIVTPDADKVMRPHHNPRLLAIANAIPRGSIYDVQGRVLATNREKEIDTLEHDISKRDRLIAARTRLYPFGPALAHLVGYVDPSVGGPFGFEKHYNAELRGYSKLNDLLHDYRNRSLPFFHVRQGRDLRLTIDAVLQRDAQNVLWQTASKLKDKVTGKPKDRAAFVLISPQTGDVLVAATTPTFDPNTLTSEQVRQFTTSPDAELEHRLINRAVHGVYPPGSTLKVATAACALDNMPNALQFAVPCNQIADSIGWKANGKSYVRRNVRDDKGDPKYGMITLPTALKVSSNIYFAHLAVALGPDTLRATLHDKMGFGHVPVQSAFDADLPDIGYGQGRMWATPIEMARLAGAVANEGKMMQTRFATSLTDPSEREKKLSFAPSLLAQSMKPQTAAILRDLMRGVVTEGTARGIFDAASVHIAGKTGTAQNRQFDNEPHSWFIGFAPYTSGQGAPPPKYAFACVVENGGYGKRVAAIICRDLLRRLY